MRLTANSVFGFVCRAGVGLSLLISSSASASEPIPELVIEKIGKGVFLHKSFNQVDGFGLVSSNGLVVVDNRKAFIVDTPWTDRDTAALVDWIREQNYEPVGSVSTHSHDDRAAGIEWLNEHSIPTFASALTNDFLKAENKATAQFALDDEVTLADGLIEAYYPGAGHTRDNIVVWLPRSKILYGGCFVRSLSSTGLGYTDEADIDEWAGSVDKVLARYPDARTVIPGHGSSGDITLLMHTRELAESASGRSVQPDPR